LVAVLFLLVSYSRVVHASASVSVDETMERLFLACLVRVVEGVEAVRLPQPLFAGVH